MFRFLLYAALTLTAAPALAAGKAAENCAVTSGIVADAVAQRVSGRAQADATATLADGDIAARFVPAVQPLVEWVYTLPQDQLTGDAAAAFQAACLEQAG
ncbi:DNA primase [Roseovarius dicentrarchi]|uniref:DNA primase n=1 Tax=Roseovarius dicentrarchi TaxID=2250573 RepID=UPI000DE95823|nr:DNA primase [Roseovarius dicentrarchi]